MSIALFPITVPDGEVEPGDPVDLIGGHTLVGFYTDGEMVDGSMTFYAYPSLADQPHTVTNADGTPYAITVSGASAYHPVDPSVFAGIRFLKPILSSSPVVPTLVTLACRRLG